MTFADISAGCALFIDANTFVYHFTLHPGLAAPCTHLLDRVFRREVTAFTSTHVLTDVAHRVMALEAVTSGLPQARVVHRLKTHPSEILKLARFQQAVADIPRFGVQVLDVSLRHVWMATTISRSIGLLSGDALIVAVMQDRGLNDLASHDGDFDRVPGLVRYDPQ